jgi:hypothetical protein
MRKPLIACALGASLVLADRCVQRRDGDVRPTESQAMCDRRGTLVTAGVVLE